MIRKFIKTQIKGELELAEDQRSLRKARTATKAAAGQECGVGGNNVPNYKQIINN